MKNIAPKYLINIETNRLFERRDSWLVGNTVNVWYFSKGETEIDWMTRTNIYKFKKAIKDSGFRFLTKAEKILYAE